MLEPTFFVSVYLMSALQILHIRCKLKRSRQNLVSESDTATKTDTTLKQTHLRSRLGVNIWSESLYEQPSLMQQQNMAMNTISQQGRQSDIAQRAAVKNGWCFT